MKKVLTLAVFLILTQLTHAQRWELGAFLGVSNYQGDLTEHSFNYPETKAAFGALMQYNITKHLSIRAGGAYGNLAADDKTAVDLSRQRRNLNFRSPIADGYLGVQVFPFGFDGSLKHYRKTFPISPYVFVGISVFHFHPYGRTPAPFVAQYGDYVSLPQLSTEGEGFSSDPTHRPYKLTQIGWPVAVGLKYPINQNWSVGLEVRWVKTITDYLDDVSTSYPSPGEFSTLGDKAALASAMSYRTWEVNGGNFYDGAYAGHQRGSSASYDSYLFSGLTVTYTIRKFACYKF